MPIQRPQQQTRCQSTVGHPNAGLPSHRDTARGNGIISLPHSQISQLPSKTPIPSPPRQPSPPIDANHPLPASPEPPPQLSKKEMPADPPDSYRSAFGGPLRRHRRRSVAPPSFPSHPLGVGYRPQSIAEACRACAVVRHASTPKSLISRSTSQSYEPSNWHTFQSLSQRLNWIVTVVITSKEQRGTCGPSLPPLPTT
jgi:hypothetical protein